VKAERKKKLLSGVVVSKNMQKTATVMVKNRRCDDYVGKVVTVRKKMHIHDPKNETKVGDTISFFIGKPISKIKYCHFDSVLAHSKDHHQEINKLKG
jgi:small subunit ribosomal protein S17